jgi:16S rRNA (uracil1498-N3)-methyltransferase
MSERDGKIRLFVRDRLGPALPVTLSKDQAHYLFGVMRRASGDRILLFNGQDGEWLAEVEEAGKRAGLLRCVSQTLPQTAPPDLWLLFAPLKKARTDFVVEKATELGASRIQPVFTRFTNADRVNADRLAATAVEAAEQCGALAAPEIAPPEKLETLLQSWDPARRILFCDERMEAATPAEALTTPGPWAILIGPEGGFAPEEAARLRALPFVIPVTLGPRILRAETAAVAALTLWQATLGDWR